MKATTTNTVYILEFTRKLFSFKRRSYYDWNNRVCSVVSFSLLGFGVHKFSSNITDTMYKLVHQGEEYMIDTIAEINARKEIEKDSRFIEMKKLNKELSYRNNDLTIKLSDGRNNVQNLKRAAESVLKTFYTDISFIERDVKNEKSETNKSL